MKFDTTILFCYTEADLPEDIRAARARAFEKNGYCGPTQTLAMLFGENLNEYATDICESCFTGDPVSVITEYATVLMNFPNCKRGVVIVQHNNGYLVLDNRMTDVPIPGHRQPTQEEKDNANGLVRYDEETMKLAANQGELEVIDGLLHWGAYLVVNS